MPIPRANLPAVTLTRGDLSAEAVASVLISMTSVPNIVALRSDRRLISAPLPDIKTWSRIPGILTFFKRTSSSDMQRLSEMFPTLASARVAYYAVEDSLPFEWPLVVPVPELADNVPELQKIAESRPDVWAFHSKGYLYLNVAATRQGVTPEQIPRAPRGGTLFIRSTVLRLQSTVTDGPRVAFNPLPAIGHMANFCFFPSVFVDDGVPHTKSTASLSNMPPYTASAEEASRRACVAFDTKGRFYSSLPSLNEWRAEEGATVLQGLFVARNTVLTARVADRVHTLLTQNLAAGESDAAVQSVTPLVCVPILSLAQISIPNLAPIFRAFRELRLPSTQEGLALALFYSRAVAGTALPGSDATSLESLMPEETLRLGAAGSGPMGVMLSALKKDLDAVRHASETIATMAKVPTEKLAAEFTSVRGRVQRMREIIATFKDAPDDVMKNHWRAALASQRLEIEALAAEVAAVADDLPHAVQSSILGRHGGLGDGLLPRVEDTVSLMMMRPEMSVEKSKEFSYMAAAVYVYSVIRTLFQTVRSTTLKHDRAGIVAVQSRAVENAFHVDGSEDSVAVVANVQRSDAEFDMQCVIFTIFPKARAVSFAVTGHALAISRSTLDSFVRRVLPNYFIQPTPISPPAQTIAGIPGGRLLWPLFVHCIGLATPATVIPEASLSRPQFEKWVAQIQASSEQMALQSSIRAAHSQIHVAQQLQARCKNSPEAQECTDPKTGAFSRLIQDSTLAQARALFAVGLYDEVVTLLSRARSTATNVVPLLPQIATAAASAPLQSRLFGQRLVQRAGREYRNGGPLCPLAV